jgi:hypothetical protein
MAGFDKMGMLVEVRDIKMQNASRQPGELYIPPFASVRLIECRDRIALVPVPSFREFFAYGRVKATEVMIELKGGQSEPFWPDCLPDEEVWMVTQWIRFEDGHEEKGSFHCLRSPKTEEDARKAMQEMIDFYSLSKDELQGGSATFSVDEIKDLSGFINRLRRQWDGVSAFLWRRLSEPEQTLLLKYQPQAPNTNQCRNVVARLLNKTVADRSIYEEVRFNGVLLGHNVTELLKRNPTGPELADLNRCLLECAYPAELSKRVIGLVQCFRAEEEDYDYIESRFPNYQSPPGDTTDLDESDLYQARLKALAGLHPKTVDLMTRAEATEDPGERRKIERAAVEMFFVELAHFWTEDEVRAWLLKNPIGKEGMCEFARVFQEVEKQIDPIKHELVLNWLRRKYNLLTEEELSDAIYKATGQRLTPGAIKKKRERLALTSKRPHGPKPNTGQ